jgi:hypothetical protein
MPKHSPVDDLTKWADMQCLQVVYAVEAVASNPYVGQEWDVTVDATADNIRTMREGAATGSATRQ